MTRQINFILKNKTYTINYCFTLLIIILISIKLDGQQITINHFIYDKNDQLITVSNSLNDSLRYDYDPTGNRIQNKVVAYCSRIVKSEFDNEYGSLRRTIECLLPNDTVFFEQTLDLSALQINNQIDLDKNLYFKQLISSQMTIESMTNDTLFYIVPQTEIYWDNLDVISNFSSPTVVNDGKLTLDNSKVTNQVGVPLINNDTIIIKNIVEIKD